MCALPRLASPMGEREHLQRGVGGPQAAEAGAECSFCEPALLFQEEPLAEGQCSRQERSDSSGIPRSSFSADMAQDAHGSSGQSLRAAVGPAKAEQLSNSSQGVRLASVACLCLPTWRRL